jgi:hypothetical protein
MVLSFFSFSFFSFGIERIFLGVFLLVAWLCSHWRWWNLFVDLGDDTRLATDCAADHSAQTSNTAAEVPKKKTMCSWSSVHLVAQILQSFSMKLSTRKDVGCLCLSSGFSLWSCLSKENSNEQSIMFTKLPWVAHYVHKTPMSSSLCSQNSHEQLIMF